MGAVSVKGAGVAAAGVKGEGEAGKKWGMQCGFFGLEAGYGESCEDHQALSYVGSGHGTYVAETTYKYVGKGAGDIEMVDLPKRIVAPWCSAWCKWLILIPIVLVAMIVIILRWVPTPKTSPAPAPAHDIVTSIATPQSCSIYGDPHVLTFDGQKVDFYTPGEFYIVKSETVVIQGKYAPTHATNGLAVTKQIAVGGPFLQGHNLIVGEEHVIWDGQRIVQVQFSEWHDPAGLVSILYNAEGEILQPDREGKLLHVLHVTLPNSVTIQVNRWNDPSEGSYINVKITMPPQPGQDGDCGNFNGNPLDDQRFLQRARVGKDGVPAEELMFLTPKTVVNKGIEDCKDAVLYSAHEQCKAVEANLWPKMSCLVAVCLGQPAA